MNCSTGDWTRKVFLNTWFLTGLVWTVEESRGIFARRTEYMNVSRTFGSQASTGKEDKGRLFVRNANPKNHAAGFAGESQVAPHPHIKGRSKRPAAWGTHTWQGTNGSWWKIRDLKKQSGVLWGK